jgi:Zn finger protein HypA/HybF involved in hydrogenase expression
MQQTINQDLKPLANILSNHTDHEAQCEAKCEAKHGAKYESQYETQARQTCPKCGRKNLELVLIDLNT